MIETHEMFENTNFIGIRSGDYVIQSLQERHEKVSPTSGKGDFRPGIYYIYNVV